MKPLTQRNIQRSSGEADATDMKAFPKATTLAFENLPSLVSFVADDLAVTWPSLDNIKVNDCPKIRQFGLGHVDVSQLKSVDIEVPSYISHYFKLQDKLSIIDKFELNSLEELTNTLTIKLNHCSFTNLKEFRATHCNERLNEFLSILLERSQHLELLVIKECEPLKHVFNLNELDSGREYFPCLKTITLWDLPQLNCIWNRDPTGIFGLGDLETMEIVKCSSLKNLISASAAEKLQKLRELKLHSCEKVEEVIAMENQEVKKQKGEIEFLLLSVLELTDLPNLIKFHRENCAVVFPSLSVLKINKCPQMIAFTTGFASAEEPSTTNERSFPKLSELELDGCVKLIHIFPSNNLSRFQHLEKLTVRNCDSLKEIFPFHGESNSVSKGEGKILFSHLNSIALENLPVLSTFCPGTLEFPKLEILKVENCPALERLVSGFREMKDLASSSDDYFLNYELWELEELILMKSKTLWTVIPSSKLQ